MDEFAQRAEKPEMIRLAPLITTDVDTTTLSGGNAGAMLHKIFALLSWGALAVGRDNH